MKNFEQISKIEFKKWSSQKFMTERQASQNASIFMWKLGQPNSWEILYILAHPWMICSRPALFLNESTGTNQLIYF